MRPDWYCIRTFHRDLAGGRITFCEPTQTARETTCARLIAETGATLIHLFENENVMAGQGTVAIELLQDAPDLDLLLCPVGGGGLLAGASVAAKALRPSIRIVATEPAGAADAARSFRAGRIVPLETTPPPSPTACARRSARRTSRSRSAAWRRS